MAKRLSATYVAPVIDQADGQPIIPVKLQECYRNSLALPGGKKYEFKNEKGELVTKRGRVATVAVVTDEEIEAGVADADDVQARILDLATAIGWTQVGLHLQSAIDLKCSARFEGYLVLQYAPTDARSRTKAWIAAQAATEHAGLFAQWLQIQIAGGAGKDVEHSLLDKAYSDHTAEINSKVERGTQQVDASVMMLPDEKRSPKMLEIERTLAKSGD